MVRPPYNRRVGESHGGDYRIWFVAFRIVRQLCSRWTGESRRKFDSRRGRPAAPAADRLDQRLSIRPVSRSNGDPAAPGSFQSMTTVERRDPDNPHLTSSWSGGGSNHAGEESGATSFELAARCAANSGEQTGRRVSLEHLLSV